MTKNTTPKWDQVILGKSQADEGTLVCWNTSNASHLLVAGSNHAGRVNALVSIISHVTTFTDYWETYVIDIKQGDEFQEYNTPEYDLNISTTYADATQTVKHIIQQLDRRLEQVLAERKSSFLELSPPLKSVLLIVNNYAKLMHEETNTVTSSLIEQSLYEISRLGRKAGIHLAISDSRPQPTPNYPALKHELAAKIVAGRVSHGYSQTTLCSATASQPLAAIPDSFIFSEYGKEKLVITSPKIN